MKERSHFTLHTLPLILSISMLCLIALLIGEMWLFRVRLHELAQCKDEYANYQEGLRRIIAEWQNREYALPGAKKKNDGPAQLIPITRDPVILHERGKWYACQQGIEKEWTEAVSGMYQKPDVITHQKSLSPIRSARSRLLHEHKATALIPLEHEMISSLKELGFVLPLERKLFRITSRFGPRKMKNGLWGYHRGIDLAAPYGTPVKAVAKGVVIEARRTRGFGNTVLISHSKEIWTRYAHLSLIEVEVGDIVEQKRRIGRVGNTGNTRGKNGVHLHLEVILYGRKQINPESIFKELRRI